MQHPLERKLAALRGRLRRLLAVYGVSRLVAAALSAVLVLGLADYLIRFHDRGIRVICSMVVLVVVAWALHRYLLVSLTARLGDVRLAQRLQRRFPALGDGLASAVEFLKQPEDDPTAGSAALRRAVIAQTTAQTEPLEFSDVIETGPTLRAAVTAVAVCLLAAIVVVLDPAATRIALARLANPFGSVAWPRKTHLELRNRVDRVARGQPFEIEVIDAFGAKLPPEVRVHYRFEGPDGADTEETELMHLLGHTMVARRENVTRPFSYRVEGGDDRSMPWIAVEVVEPPAIESLAIKLIPPDYTGWPVEKAQRHLRALVGTRVRMAGRATKPLEAVAVCLGGKRIIPGRLDDDGLRFAIPGNEVARFVIDKSGAYWFKLTDREGLTGGTGTRWEIRAVADRPPSVSIEQPASTVFVTPRAVIPLRVSAKDDLAIRRVGLVLEPADGAEPAAPGREIPLYEGPEHVESLPGGGLSSTELGEHRLIDTRWELSELQLQPGTQLTFHVTATDYLPQTGKSQPRRLVIITPEELADRIAARQTSIVAELARVLKMQRQGRAQLADLEVRLGELRRFDRLDVDHLRGAELNQRQIDRGLSSPSEGVPMHILGLLADLENNKVDSPDVSRRMHSLLEGIDRLSREHLPLIGRELTTAIKAAQIRLQDEKGTRFNLCEAPSGPLGQIKPGPFFGLATAGKHQDEVIGALERMLARLSRWDDFRRFHREIGQMLRDQQELARRTAELARQTLTKEPKDLQPRESADLKVHARQQAELARRLDRALQEMDETSRRPRDADPLAAETVADAFDRAAELAVSGKMREAAGQVEHNRMGQAIGRQKQIIRDLQEVLDILANRRVHELVRLQDAVRSLHRHQQEACDETRRLDRLRQTQGRLNQSQIAELRTLANRQRSLGSETASLAEKGTRFNLCEAPSGPLGQIKPGPFFGRGRAFGLALSGAAGEMGLAAGLLDRGRTGTAARKAQQGAVRRLAMLLEALKPEEPGSQSDSAGAGQEQGKMPGGGVQQPGVQALAELKLLKLFQQEINLRTRQLEKSVGPTKQLTPDARREYENLGTEQGRLADLLLELLEPREK